MLKYGDDSRKIESVMACFDRGGGKAPPPAAYIPFYRLHPIGLMPGGGGTEPISDVMPGLRSEKWTLVMAWRGMISGP